MKSCIFLIIILDFVRISLCFVPLNVSEENVCPVSWFRRKRADGEYTRWRSNMETTAEFIVKVLDDDVTIGTTKLVGVNIQPVPSRNERIIVGGAMLPSTPSVSPDLLRDYTRFKPPTKDKAEAAEAGQPYLAATPFFRDAFHPIQQDRVPSPYVSLNPARKANRDDSPPGSPQFLPRTPPDTRQYAPIAPVTFTRRTTGTPLTPPYDLYNQYLTRSSSPPSPTRTMGLTDKLEKLEDFPVLDALIPDDDSQFVITRTTIKNALVRTQPYITQPYVNTENVDVELNRYFSKSTMRDHSNIESTIQIFTEKFSEFNELDEKELDQRRDNTDSEKDINYNNMFFYNIDYKDSNSTDEMDTSQSTEIEDKVQNENSSKTELHNDHFDISSLDALEESDPIMSVMENKAADTKYPKTLMTSSTDRVHFVRDDPRLSAVVSGDVVSRDKRHPVCNMIKLRPLSFNTPRTLPEIVDQLKQWTEDSPIAKLSDMTGGNLTIMENPIYVITVDDPSAGQATGQKQNVLLISGINGRDHFAVSSAMYVLYQLIERSETHKDLLKKYRFWIVPVFNPDGYDYSKTFPQRRDWLKNLRQSWELCKGRESCQHCSTHGIRCTVSPCYGVNLDRNFEYQWISSSELRSEHPCGNLYAGPRQMSEVETQALNNYLHSQHMTISVFIAFKEGEVLGVLYPYSHTKKRRAFDQIYRQRARLAAEAASSITNRKYIAGQNSEFLHLLLFFSPKQKSFFYRPYISHYQAAKKPPASGLFATKYYFGGIGHYKSHCLRNGTWHCYDDDIVGKATNSKALYAGGIEDWADGHLGIDNTYTVMMFRPVDVANAKFLAEKIIHEAYAAMDSLLLTNVPGRTQPLTLMKAKASSLHASTLAVLLTTLASYIFS